MKSSQLNLDQSHSKMLDFFLRAFEKMWCALRNCGK